MEDRLILRCWKTFQAREMNLAQLIDQDLWMQDFSFRANTCLSHVLDKMIKGLAFLELTLLCIEQL